MPIFGPQDSDPKFGDGRRKSKHGQENDVGFKTSSDSKCLVSQNHVEEDNNFNIHKHKDNQHVQEDKVRTKDNQLVTPMSSSYQKPKNTSEFYTGIIVFVIILLASIINKIKYFLYSILDVIAGIFYSIGRSISYAASYTSKYFIRKFSRKFAKFLASTALLSLAIYIFWQVNPQWHSEYNVGKDTANDFLSEQLGVTLPNIPGIEDIYNIFTGSQPPQ